MNSPLRGIRIIDLTQFIAGASATQLLGDLGAEVIKIEPPKGELVRKVMAGPKFQDDSYMYLAFNRNKKSITLNLKSESGRKVFYDLVKISDVVIDNFRADAIKKLRADYETLKRINPLIISISISGYGDSGPSSNLPCFDIVAQAESGVASITGEADGPPVKCGPAIIDIGAGIFGALAVVSALYNRNQVGTGQRIDLSLLDVGIYFMACHIGYYACSQEIPRRLGGRHIASNPYGIYPTKDGYMAIGISWPKIAEILGLQDMINDPRFTDADSRFKHRKELDEIITTALQKKGAQEWVRILRSADISASMVNNIEEAIRNEQVIHRNMILDTKHPKGGSIRLAANPLKRSDRLIKEGYTPPPLLGQHNKEVFINLLGYLEDNLDFLKNGR